MRDARLYGSLLGLTLSLGIVDATGCFSQRRYAPAIAWQPATLRRTPKLTHLLNAWVHQKTEASCSVASTATVLNAVLAMRGKPAVAQNDLLAADPTGRWARDTQNALAPGVTLDEMPLYVLQSFRAQGIKRVAVDVVHVRDTHADTAHRLAHVLEKGEEEQDNHFVILNFLQAAYVANTADIGHMSVIAQYDAAKDRALVLDVDLDALQPYWVPMQVLLAGMCTPDSTTGDFRGYLVVRLQ